MKKIFDYEKKFHDKNNHEFEKLEKNLYDNHFEIFKITEI